MKYDLLIKNGHVIDPANEIDAVLSVAVKDGVIAAVGCDLVEAESLKVIDAEGLFVTPGLIDMHTHIYPVFPLHQDSLFTVNPDTCMFQSGVTTAVDAGTTGINNFPVFKEEIIDKAAVRVFGMINISDDGMVHLDHENEPLTFHPQRVAEMAKHYNDVVVGIKTAHYWVGVPFDEVHTPWASVDSTVEAAALCGKRAMFDYQPNPNPPGRTYEQLIMEHARPGDIHTHVYAQQFHYIDENGKMADFMFKARERGVLFDLGHGACSFWFRNAIPALKQGFYPDTISTDLYADNICGPVFSMNTVMSKYLAMGMAFKEIIYRTTQRPAEIIGHPELGTLSAGACADIALLRINQGRYSYCDGGRARIDGTEKISCEGTIRAGKLVYNPNAWMMPKWEEAPEAYWVAPGILQ